MRKIPLLSLILSATALFSCGTNTVGHGENNLPNQLEGTASYTITSVAQTGITVDVVGQAAAGEIVDVTLTYDASVHVVDYVAVNTETAMKLSDTLYRFIMPSSNVELEVVSSYVDPNYGKHEITNYSQDKGVVLVGLPALAKAGEEISFKVTFTVGSAYTFNDKITVETNEETPTTIEHSFLEGKYHFTMPDKAVRIVVGTYSRPFAIAKAESTINISKQEIYDTETETWTNLSYSYEQLVNAGSRIRVTLKDTTAKKALGLKFADETELLIEDKETSMAVEFVMPAHNVSYEVLTEINYKPVTLVNSEHIQIKLVEKVEETWVALQENKAIPTEYTYFKLENTDTQYVLDKVTITYNGTSKLTPTVEDEANNVYKFTMKDCEDLTITVTELFAAYAGYAFNSTNYISKNIYSLSGNCVTKSNDSFTSTIAFSNNGTSVIKVSSSKTAEITSITGNEERGIINTSLNSNIAYGNNVIVRGFSTDKKISEKTTDFYFLYKTQAGETNNDYKIQGLYLDITGGTKPNYFLIQVTKGDEVVSGSIFDFSLTADEIDANTHLYLDNVTFEVTGDTYVSGANATRIVAKVGDTVLKTFEKATNQWSIVTEGAE